MANGESKSYTFVEETESDNGYDSLSALLRIGELSASSVEDMIDQIVADLGAQDCIESLTIIGHGAPGTISVGNGQTGTDSAKEIDGGNEAVWGPQLDRIRCRFCQGGIVYLRGCNVGAERAGAQKLFRIAQRLRCAIVQAPTGVCNPIFTTGEDQEARPGEVNPPRALPNPDRKKKKKKGTGELSRLVAGTDLQNLTQFDAEQIAAARYLPRELGRPFAPELLEELGVDLPKRLVAQLAQGLEGATPQWLPVHGFSLDGYLRLTIREDRGPRKLPPGALIGGLSYYTVLGGDTTLVYVLPGVLVRRLRAFHRRHFEAPAS